jgi:hypothetical protein
MRSRSGLPPSATAQADGAIPNGSRVEKCWTLPGDRHDNGAQATVRGSVGPFRYVTGDCYGYWVEWDGDPPGLVCFVISLKIRSL